MLADFDQMTYSTVDNGERLPTVQASERIQCRVNRYTLYRTADGTQTVKGHQNASDLTGEMNKGYRRAPQHQTAHKLCNKG